ncbi:DUF1203 domain-containing protein [Gellertiella hungarica]|uniref:DUF1203 domain-containing protein n=1 Tax=Gellertiella hungarica TaxID=1572859 RepID=A0A7W6J7G6_9HYPH|nr:DUF1203 domain-containing protein [Gellertiella hungarica]MBB4065342.1 hypothetical protein [Gellertiella hungarica]
MSFKIRGLSPQTFSSLFRLSDQELLQQGAHRLVVDAKPGFPDRIALRDCDLGETVLLVNFTHQPANTPYRSSHAIFVREGEDHPFEAIDTVPEVMRSRLLSLRAFSREHMILDAGVVNGDTVEHLIEEFLARPDTDYIHIHFANRGCYLARVDRA